MSNCFTAGIENVDIITLIEEFKGLYFTSALYWVCGLLGIEYYSNDLEDEADNIIDDWKWMKPLLGSREDDERVPLMPISKSILNRFIRRPNNIFLSDGVNAQTQNEFELCFNMQDEYIIIPIYDEIGNLVGTKGRCTRKEDEQDWKFISHYKYPKTKLLYGLYKTYPYIKAKNEVIIVEAEKSVMKLWQYGHLNAVALGGKSISESQLEKIKKLNVPVVLAFDKDVSGEHINYVINRLKLYTNISVVYDNTDILCEKESPCDKLDKWRFLYSKKYNI